MTITLRQFAVSGSAAVALLGGAAAITLADSPTASATTQTAAHRAATAPVTLPDGRTIRIAGMGGYGHQATDAHVATVAAYKTGSTGGATGLTPDGSVGAPLQNPYNTGQVPATYQQQISTQSSGGVALGAGIVAILVLGVIVFFKIKHGHLKVGDVVLVGLLGVALSGTVIGTMAHQITNSGVSSLGGVLGGL